jgi:hypothetical protein
LEANEFLAAKLYEAAAESGFAQAQMNLALMYQQGRGVPQDLEQALQLYKAAADQGHPGALHRTGKLLEQGIDGRADLQSALK